MFALYAFVNDAHLCKLFGISKIVEVYALLRMSNNIMNILNVNLNRQFCISQIT